MQFGHVIAGDTDPAILAYVVEVDCAPRVGIAVCSLVDGATGQIAGFFDGEIVRVATVHHSVGVDRTGAH